MLPYWRPSYLVLRLVAIALLFPGLFPVFGQIRDGGIDPKNLGKGDWIYILSSAINQMGGNAPAVTNLTSLMAYQKNQGCQYIIIKAADGHVRFPTEASPQFTGAVVDAAHAAGLKIFGYNRSFGTNIPGELAMVNEVFNLGADGFVIDAESEWKTANLPNNTIIATNFLSAIRTNWPNKFIGHSPFAFINSHSTFPYKEFGYYCDVAMPQIYFIEFGMTASAAVAQTSSQWRNWQNGLTGIWTNAIKPIVPVGQAWSGSAVCTAADITEFVNALKNDPLPATAGGYKGVNYWRADLHPPDVLAAIRTNNIGDVSTNPPAVTNVSVSVSDTSASFTWTTDQSSDSVIEYGLTTGYGSSVTNATMLYYHSASVSGLSPNTTYHFRARSRNAANQFGYSADYVFTTLAAPVPDVIVDDLNVNYVGGWTVGSGTSGFSGTEYRFASTAAGGPSTATFRPNIAVAGNYDIYLWFIAGSNRATNAPYTIVYNGGTNSVSVNQSANPGGWLKIASARPFASGTNGYIQLSNDVGYSGKVVISDAVKLVYLPPPPSPPSIATQPENQVVNQGNTAIFSVTASGAAPLSYQWRRSGTNLAGATLSQYTINNAQPADMGTYSVFITNSVGSLLSSNATLTVNVPPQITQQPQSVSTNVGADVLFAVAATGTAPLFYQWRFNGTPINGATGTSYTRTNAQNPDAGAYSVSVSNVANVVISADAVLSFPPSTAQPNIDAITMSPGGVQLLMSGGPGNFALEVSPELLNWTQYTTLNPTGAVFQYTDPETNWPTRFFRLRVMP